MSRYLRNRSVLVWTSMPSATLVTQAGRSLLDPFTSVRHMRHAPTLLRPCKWQSVGMLIPASKAASRMVSPSSAVACCRPLLVFLRP